VGKIGAAAVGTAELADDDAVTTAKLAHGTADTLVGFDAGGVPGEVAAGSHVTIAGGTIAVVPGSLPSAPLRGSAVDSTRRCT
jgi:hypothetical protein